MKLIIIRHAHRDKPEGGHADNGLSDLGRVQAQALGEFYGRRFSGKPVLLLSSPKRRCVETLEPISLRAGVKTVIDPLLDEGADLAGKTLSFIRKLKKDDESIVVACSHGDWIPEFLRRMTGARIDPSKGSWVELEWDPASKQSAEIGWVIQDFSPLR